VSSGRKALIRYLYHSGFTVEYEDYFLVFDYYKQKQVGLDQINRSTLNIKEAISKYKKPFVFVSHSHYDHYNPEIFGWKDSNPNLQFILSNDIKPKVSRTSCFFMGPYEKMVTGDMTVSTYDSTDIGVSFLLNVNGLRIFHAGDLNWWHWADESTEDELREEEEKFKSQVSRFENESIDILFFPVDPRLGDYYWLGGGYMIEKFRPGLFVPMHFGDDKEITRQFAAKMTDTGVNAAVITNEEQIIEYRI